MLTQIKLRIEKMTVNLTLPRFWYWSELLYKPEDFIVATDANAPQQHSSDQESELSHHIHSSKLAFSLALH